MDGEATTPAAEATVSLPALTSYLRDVVPHAIGGGEGHLATALASREGISSLTKFTEDPSVTTLVISRTLTKEEDGTEEESEKDQGEKDADAGAAAMPPFLISTSIEYVSTRVASVAFVKKASSVAADKPLHTQLQIFTYSGAPYDVLHNIINGAVTPYFNSAVIVQRQAEKLGVKGVRKAMGDLELSLRQLQRDVQVPEVTLPIHPVVKEVIAKATAEGRKPTVQDFADKVEDSNFLNALQKGVTRWIREMQKVTRLDPDPSTGTTMQEISFWHNMDRALQALKVQRDSVEVVLTLEVLKQGKRFHATVGFDSDTGLQKALETVNNYNILIKDFPLNNLLAATDIDSIRAALIDIFSHLKKIRNTNYPVARAQALVQAISRDLNEQLLKVLTSQQLMHVSFDEFEHIVKDYSDVFRV